MKKTVFVDDLTGEEASTSLTFGLDDKIYEIDLSDEHAQELRETLQKYASVAREKLRVPREALEEEDRFATSTQVHSNSREIRRWARRQGYNVKGFGRIPSNVMRDWERSQGINPMRRSTDTAA